MPFMDCVDPETREFRSPDQLRDLFKSAGVDLNRPVIATCGSGKTEFLYLNIVNPLNLVAG